jgi:hypothetical protein
VTLLNSIYLFSYAVHVWVELKACKWPCCAQIHSEIFYNSQNVIFKIIDNHLTLDFEFQQTHSNNLPKRNKKRTFNFVSIVRDWKVRKKKRKQY